MLRVQSVARELERRIVDGDYPVGIQLPTEPDLAREFAVSRTTVRDAVTDLQARGLVSRQQGRGTFVQRKSTERVNIVLEANLSVTDVIRESGRKPGTTGLSLSREIAPDEVLVALRLPAGSWCVVVRRTRTADEIPVADSTDYLLDVPGLPKAVEAYEHSIYELLERTHHRSVSYGTASIDAVLASGLTAERLALEDGSPILVLSQVHELSGRTPVMYSVISLRSDVVNLYVHRGDQSDGSLHKSENAVDA